MPSPFPGMDPYLENPDRWPGLRSQLLVLIKEQLNAALRPRYAALADARTYVTHVDDPGRAVLNPYDIAYHRDDRPAQVSEAGEASPPPMAKPIEIPQLLDVQIKDLFINVFRVEDRGVVSVIEVLTPANKLPDGHGRRALSRMRRRALRSPVNWIEIDLLRRGERLQSDVRHLGDYMVYVAVVTSSGRREQLWPIKLPQQLPVVSIPLEGDATIPLDLQKAFLRVYDQGPYDLIVDYRRDPVPPLPSHYVEWADGLLREKELRAAS